MATLIVKFGDESQYNGQMSTIIYKDATPARWEKKFNKLKNGDKGIFHSTEKLYVGDFESKNSGVSVTFNNIKITNIGFADLMRINEIEPEKIAVLKRPRDPIFMASSIDVNAIYNAAQKKDFISFFIFKGEDKPKDLSEFKDNDRIIWVDQQNKVKDLFVKSAGELTSKNFGSDLFGSKDFTLDQINEILQKNDKKPHIKTIKEIISKININPIYKLNNYNDYYNIFHNKSIFQNEIKKAKKAQDPPGGIGKTDNSENDNNFSIKDRLFKNIILYGPPGTGKTFHSITYAVSIIDGTNVAQLLQNCKTEQGRTQIKKRYDELVDSGKIVFTTFHQSLSYEDFIEGIKPLKPKNRQPLKYDVEDGIFKKICKDAKKGSSIIRKESEQETAETNNFVLIIDEINRGNVSQIFGELITLIEPDKRQEAPEALKIVLPYSKEKFSVPQNLYIIGTMNTADRSVEALDTALRRRFSFIQMLPDHELLTDNCDEINLKLMLETLNKRLKILKDNDHTIGHAWLWNVDKFEKLKEVFKDKIVPLLQEYFYNDFEKLGLVIGDDFVIKDFVALDNTFAKFYNDNRLQNQYKNKSVYRIKDSSEWKVEDFISIYNNKEN